MDRERQRKAAQIALVAVAAGLAAAAGYRYQVTRGDRPQPLPEGKAVRAVPASGPVGSRPFLQLFGWRPGEQVKVLFCAEGSLPLECADLGTARFPGRNFQARRVPATVKRGGGPVPVAPGSYVLRAGTLKERPPPMRGRFTVVPFVIAPAPSPRSYASVDPRTLELGPPRQIARGAACETRFTPDDRLVIANSVFDPRTAVGVEMGVTAAEFAWSAKGDRLAIVTEDRKEIRMASPDGSGAEVVDREARGLISSLTWSREGDRIAYVVRPQPGVRGGPKEPTVFVQSLVDGSKASAGGGEAVAWSPKVDRLAVEVVEGSGRAIHISDTGGKRTRLVDGRRPAWSPDGSLLVFVRPVSGEAGAAWVTRADTPGGATLLVRQDVCGVAFSADGDRLAVVTKAGAATTLVLRSISTGASRR